MADANAFSAHRDHLTGVAYRMLGSRADAEDAVQDAWLRYANADPTAGPAGIADLRAWLTTVTARICLDQLRSARVRRESYVGPWLPEPIVRRLPDDSGPAAAFPDPAEQATRSDEVGLALLVVLERLSPEQRVAFVLHDVFAVPFDEIAPILATTPAAARQLASRARRAVATDSVRRTPDRTQQLAVLSAFLAAAHSGDIDAPRRVRSAAPASCRSRRTTSSRPPWRRGAPRCRAAPGPGGAPPSAPIARGSGTPTSAAGDRQRRGPARVPAGNVAARRGTRRSG